MIYTGRSTRRPCRPPLMLFAARGRHLLAAVRHPLRDCLPAVPILAAHQFLRCVMNDRPHGVVDPLVPAGRWAS